MIFHRTTLWGILCLLSFNLIGQPSDTIRTANYWQVGGFSGFIYAHHRSMGYYLNEYPWGAQIKYGKKFFGSVDWHQAFRHPEAGAAFLMVDFGNKAVLGNGYATYGYLDIPVFERRRFTWNYEMGAGIGYITKIFNIDNNYNNQAIGSHLNAFLLISTGIKYRITSKFLLAADWGLHHFSNGNATEPNQGLNTFYSMIGMRYSINNKTQTIPTIKNDNIRQNAWQCLLHISSGFKEERPIDHTKYPIVDIHTTFRRKISPTNSWGFGVDLMYDRSISKVLKNDFGNGYLVHDSIYNPSEWKNFTPAMHANWSMLFGRITFSIQAGVYLYSALDRVIFNRWLLEVAINDKISIAGGLKSHFASADYIEYGLVWKIIR
ncbi:MAG TPA: acyloxyacyl hydrolase [Salinivirgaceae bacterium]|nr:acyloxyacyl hydrolase [Salinivirgaceae bacterium]